jgi:hypothetical protein
MTVEAKLRVAKERSKRPRKRKPKVDDRHLRIQEGAYFRAERDGFQRSEVEYWLAAEAEIGAQGAQS